VTLEDEIEGITSLPINEPAEQRKSYLRRKKFWSYTAGKGLCKISPFHDKI